MVGQVAVSVPDHQPSEAQAAEEIWSTCLMCSEMGARVSKGLVSSVTDIVIEDFILRERTSSRDLLSPVRLTAQLVLLAQQERKRMRLHFSPPAGKSVVSDERLKRWGLYTTKPHARDALRHLVLTLRTLSG
jgi:hypothetical protein